MSNSSEASGMSASFSGGGLFRISEMFRRTFLLHPLCCKKGSLFVFDDGVCMSLVFFPAKWSLLNTSGLSAFRAPWRRGDSVVGRRNAGWTTLKSGPTHARSAHNGLLQKRLEEDLCWIIPHVHLVPQSVKGMNWTGLQLDISVKIGYVMKMAWMSQWVVSLLDLVMEGCGFEFWFWEKKTKNLPKPQVDE